MKFTLRKAAVLQRNLLDEMKAINFETTVDLNVYEDSEAVLKKNFDALNQKLQNYSSMSRQLYYIRKVVAKANQESGIDDLLADLANLDKHIGMWEAMKTSTIRVAPEVILGNLEKMKAKPADAYSYRSDSLTVSLVTQEAMDLVLKQLAACKAEKQALQDKLLHLNVTTEIELATQEETEAAEKEAAEEDSRREYLAVESANEAAASYSAADDGDIG